ncbi:hypothetical protein SLEP1_g57140 [Rubroshorea leprosula]|uniref:Cytochrome P450 n=1 Tax=Rubroshorea leprosula TaxID=152421 RepID=A0AAV5MPB9_9ROSI|nr:hypothetical protein SLEP1_g57140 [Rubroshorea leprosula]
MKLLHLIHAIMSPKSKNLHHKADGILENIIMEHKAKRASRWIEIDDLVYVLLDLQEHGKLEMPFKTDNIKAVIMDIFMGGDETSTVIVEWAMSEMLKNLRVVEKAQPEVRRVFPREGSADEAGIRELKYLNLVIKETLRLHPAEEKAEGAEKFLPERFLDSTADYKGSGFEFIPFGAGRRMCVRISSAPAIIEPEPANLLYHFDWKLPEGQNPENFDMTEDFRGVARRKHDLWLVPIP